jgi:DNA-binding XRE family transcriptional regulator
MSNNNTSPKGRRWEEIRTELFSPEERAASAVRVALMQELTKARSEQGMSQKKLEELSGVTQSVISRMETGATSPQLDTVVKLLASFGKTIAIVPLETSENAV